MEPTKKVKTNSETDALTSLKRVKNILKSIFYYKIFKI